MNTVGSLVKSCEMAARENVSVGIIGMGDMGKMYARAIAAAGWRFVTHFFFLSFPVKFASLPSLSFSFSFSLFLGNAKTKLEVSMLATGKKSSRA